MSKGEGRKGIAEALKRARESKETDEPEESEDGLVSMKLDKKEKDKSYPVALSGNTNQDDYSYGTRLNLRKEDLDKLGIEDLPKVGEKFRLVAEVEVISVSASASKDNDNQDMGLQITAMKLS